MEQKHGRHQTGCLRNWMCFKVGAFDEYGVSTGGIMSEMKTSFVWPAKNLCPAPSKRIDYNGWVKSCVWMTIGSQEEYMSGLHLERDREVDLEADGQIW